MNPLLYIPECESTNSEIVNHIFSENDCFTGVYTFNQTKGRGQYGNEWLAPKNLNLAYSLAIKKDLVKTSDILFNFHTAVMVREFIAKMTNSSVKIKWPNDLILEGKKIAGTLIEKQKINDTQYLIFGIGINILQQNFENLPKAGSIFTQIGKKLDLKEFSQGLHKTLCEGLKKKVSNEEILTNYNHFLFRKHEISVFEYQNIRQNGIIKNVDEKGYIWIDLDKSGLQRFFHKEIEMLY